MLRSIFGASLLAASLAGQQTYVVDAAGGGDFTNLAAAFAAVQHGDRVEVRTGTYEAGTLRAGIELIADPGTRLAAGGTLLVTGIPASAQATIVGFQNPQGGLIGGGFGIVLRNNPGGVHVQDIESTFTGYSTSVTLAIEDCPRVTMTRCRLRGTPALAVNRSSVICQLSSLSGGSIYPGCSLDGHLELIDCKLIGGSSLLSPQPGLRIWSGSATATGSTTFDGGSTTLTNRDFADIVVGARGSLTIDPSTNADIIEGVHSVRPIPALTLTSAPGSPSLGLAIHPASAAFAAVVAGLPTPPGPTSLGNLWVDPSTAAILHFGPVPPGGLRQGVPTWAQDTSIAFQALIVPQTGPAALSPPLVLHTR